MVALPKQHPSFLIDENGDVVVEATILFPIMIMIFAALVLLSIFLPTRGALQRATQYAATAFATTSSDTWLYFDKSSMTFDWITNKADLENVYAALFSNRDVLLFSEDVVTELEGKSLSSKTGQFSVDAYLANHIIYKEVIVTATREFTLPIDLNFLSFIGFPQTIPVTVTSTAVIQNGDEFIRNVDIAVDFIEYLNEKFELSDISGSISTFGDKVKTLLGW